MTECMNVSVSCFPQTNEGFAIGVGEGSEWALFGVGGPGPASFGSCSSTEVAAGSLRQA